MNCRLAFGSKFKYFVNKYRNIKSQAYYQGIQKKQNHPKINSIKVEENSYSSNKPTLEDQIKKEKFDDVCQINDSLQLQQQKVQLQLRQNQQHSQLHQQQHQVQLQLRQNQKHVEQTVRNDEININFCISWIKANYKFVKKSIIVQQNMYQHYMTSLKKFFSKKYVISLHNFSNCVRCVN